MAAVIVFAETFSLLKSLPPDMPLSVLRDFIWSIGDDELARLVVDRAEWPENWSLECERADLSASVLEWQGELGKHAMITEVWKHCKLVQ